MFGCVAPKGNSKNIYPWTLNYSIEKFKNAYYSLEYLSTDTGIAPSPAIDIREYGETNCVFNKEKLLYAMEGDCRGDSMTNDSSAFNKMYEYIADDNEYDFVIGDRNTPEEDSVRRIILNNIILHISCPHIWVEEYGRQVWNLNYHSTVVVCVKCYKEEERKSLNVSPTGGGYDYRFNIPGISIINTYVNK